MAFGDDRPITVVGRNAHDPRQKRDHFRGIEPHGTYFGCQHSEPLVGVGGTANAAAAFDQDAKWMQADVAVKRRPVQLQHRTAVAFGKLRRRGDESALTDSGLAPEDHARRGQAARLRSRPGLLEPHEFTVAADQRTSLDPGRLDTLTEEREVLERLRSLDQRCFAALHVERICDEEATTSETTTDPGGARRTRAAIGAKP